MPDFLILAGVIGVAAAGAALWLQNRRRTDRRFVAGLVATAVTLSLFSVIAWAATAIARVVPLSVSWALVGMLALVFALRLYRELETPPPSEPR